MPTLNIADIIEAVESDPTLKSELSKPQFQEQFKQYVSNVGNIALAIERRETPDEAAQQQLHKVGNTVLRFYELDSDKMRDAFLFADYSAEQCAEIQAACQSTLANLKKTSTLTFDCQIKNAPLMQDIRTRKIVHGPSKNKTPSESLQRAFIQYLQHEGLPSEVLERMARLSLYQEFHLVEDLKTNKQLKKYYDQFEAKGSLKTADIIEATKLMETLQLTRLQANRVVLERDTENGLDIARAKKTTRPAIDTLYKSANARELDAYTVHNRTLIAACVTTHTDLERNALSALTFLRAAHHSFIKNPALLKNIDDAQVQVYCNAEPVARRELGSALTYLQSRALIKAPQEQQFIQLPLHQEILKFMANIATAEYDIYAPKVALGVYGSNGRNIGFDSDPKKQIVISVAAIADAANTLKMVVEANPRLEKILGAVERLGSQLSESYTYATELRQRYNIMMNADVSNNLDAIHDVLVDLQHNLTSAGSRYTSGVLPRVTTDRAVRQRDDQLTHTFNDRENALKHNQPTSYALQKAKQYSNITQTASTMTTSNLGCLLSGTGPYVNNKNKALLRDGLIERANRMDTMLVEKNFMKSSMKQLLKGLSRLNDKAMEKEVYTHVFTKTPALKSYVMESSQELGPKDSPQAFLHAALVSMNKQLVKNRTFESSSPSI